MIFTSEQIVRLKELRAIANISISFNDKRTANSLNEILDIFFETLNNLGKDKLNVLKKEFLQITDWEGSGYSDELLIACQNTAQYERGLEIINILAFLELSSFRETAEDKAIFLTALGQSDKAEELLKNLLISEPDNVWLYIKLGDIYFIDTVLDEHRDFRKAEQWYYGAYDQEIGKKDKESWTVLLDRIAEVTVKRLRFDSEKKLLACLEKNKIGGLDTLYQLKQNVYISGSESIIFQHLQSAICWRCPESEEVNDNLKILTDAYNLMLQKGLNDLSPFEMVEYFPKGINEVRILDEMLSAFKKYSEAEQTEIKSEALISQQFSDFQVEFLDQKDDVTGEKRRAIIGRERSKTEKDFKRGKFIWEGFVRYRRN